MIIDVHAHLGYDRCYGTDNPEDQLIYWQDKCGIDHAIVGMASISPQLRPEEYERELRRCVNELGFVGVKITPAGHGLNPGIKDVWWIYELCEKLDIPVMIHTGSGAPFSDPINIYEPAKNFKNVRFVIAHAGSDSIHATALHVAKLCPNVYLEPSWLCVYLVLSTVRAIGAERVMFSSDLAMNAPVELAKYNALPVSEPEREQLLYKAAKTVYKLKV